MLRGHQAGASIPSGAQLEQHEGKVRIAAAHSATCFRELTLVIGDIHYCDRRTDVEAVFTSAAAMDEVYE